VKPLYSRLLRFALVAVAALVLSLSFALACAFVYVAPALPTAENMHSVELAVPLRVYSAGRGPWCRRSASSGASR
jgi:membrane carboxypeptidase/penicillin-binding protein